MSRKSIALFDSGVGGLTVLKELQRLLPNQHFIYFSDSAHFPYGKKSAAELIAYASEITSFLLQHDVEQIVIPCHTASALALPALQERFSIPMIGMIESTISALKETTKNRRIALMGTEGTIGSGIYQRLIEKELPGSKLFPLTCPQLEQSIEQGRFDVAELIRSCIAPICGEQVDTLILGCTHYPHIRKQIEEELDPMTVILDPAERLAEEVAKRAAKNEGPSSTRKNLFYISGDLDRFNQFIAKHPISGRIEIQQAIPF